MGGHSGPRCYILVSVTINMVFYTLKILIHLISEIHQSVGKSSLKLLFLKKIRTQKSRKTQRLNTYFLTLGPLQHSSVQVLYTDV